MSDEEKMPEVARRRGGADTLFSAEWFDDNDEFTGTKPEGARENVSIPSTAPVAQAKAEAPSTPAKADEPVERSGPSVAVIVVVLAVVFLGGGCLFGAAGAGALFALGLVP